MKGLGYLTIDTLKGILLELEPNLPDEQLMEIVEEVDEDGSGTIDFDGMNVERSHFNHGLIVILYSFTFFLNYFFVFFLTSEFMGMMMG